ncbi:MAG TPA: DUF4149 domain-containing protein [Pyrinomonadaceae bacterium]|nr:DUF4149 domain-containing protein [Pyrinomonadaceae bacterium]
MKFLNDIRQLILAVWLGSAITFIIAAQVAFAVLPERELAGQIVSRLLAMVNFSAIAAAFAVFLLSLVGSARVSPILLWLDRGLAILMAAAAGIGQFVSSVLIGAVRAEIGSRTIDSLAADDPLKLRFDQLHQVSVWLLATAMICAFLLYFVIANRRLRPVEVQTAEKAE